MVISDEDIVLHRVFTTSLYELNILEGPNLKTSCIDTMGYVSNICNSIFLLKLYGSEKKTVSQNVLLNCSQFTFNRCKDSIYELACFAVYTIFHGVLLSAIDIICCKKKSIKPRLSIVLKNRIRNTTFNLFPRVLIYQN